MPYADETVGETRQTRARTVTEADIVNFAGVSGDFNHHHTDAVRMGDSHFEGRIAHGMLVLSMASGLVWQSQTKAERDAVVAFYGLDALRFTGPTFAGDTIHCEVEVLGKRETDGPGSGVVIYGLAVVNDTGETVLTCELSVLLH